MSNNFYLIKLLTPNIFSLLLPEENSAAEPLTEHFLFLKLNYGSIKRVSMICQSGEYPGPGPLSDHLLGAIIVAPRCVRAKYAANHE